MDNRTSIGQRVRALRKSKGMTQVELAAECGIGRSTITGIELGTADPGRISIESIAEFFQVSIGYLYGEEDLPSFGDHVAQLRDEARHVKLVRVFEKLDDDQQIRMLDLLESLVGKPGNLG